VLADRQAPRNGEGRAGGGAAARKDRNRLRTLDSSRSSTKRQAVESLRKADAMFSKFTVPTRVKPVPGLRVLLMVAKAGLAKAIRILVEQEEGRSDSFMLCSLNRYWKLKQCLAGAYPQT
jgi:hypothetical protein